MPKAVSSGLIARNMGATKAIKKAFQMSLNEPSGLTV
jgi:hypothetical protein